ncbi:MAG: peptide chain release factor N(5)-glutamine methyltransferase [Geminicoccaceae bacterium]
MTTVESLLVSGARRLRDAGVPNPRAEARLLLAHATGLDRARQTADPAHDVPQEQVSTFAALLDRRTAREPIAYILGRAEFWSLPFAVRPGVLVPRADTETLIEAALAALPDRTRPLRILDIGTGTGILLLTLLTLFAKATGVGTDLADTALDLTAANATALGVADRARIVRTSFADGVDGPFDLVVSNPPYIPTGDIEGLEPEVRDREPRLALDGGSDGLDAYRAIIAALPRLLVTRALAILEIGKDQERAIEALAAKAGFAVDPRRDLAGIVRCLILRRIS